MTIHAQTDVYYMTAEGVDNDTRLNLNVINSGFRDPTEAFLKLRSHLTSKSPIGPNLQVLSFNKVDLYAN